MSLKSKYISSAFLLLLSTVMVKAISAVYKIPLTAFIGGVGRGYFAYAYNLCLPVHAVTMGAFPIALSKLVSMYYSKGETDKVCSLKKGSIRFFAIIGIVGMAVIICVSKPYACFVADSPKAVYTMLVLAPSVLFSCMGASYRGYFEGLLNMVPTAISQALEALFKMIFGLLFARYSMSYLFKQYILYGTVFGTSAPNEQVALSLIYPFTSAFAMLGVTLGSLVSLCFLSVYSAFHTEKTNAKFNTKSANRELLVFSFPIMISTCVQSVFQFLDTATIQFALARVDVCAIKLMFSKALSVANVTDKDLPTYVYGLLSSSLDFKNLVPSITMALGISAVPAISRAFEQNNKALFDSIVNSIYKYTAIISLLGGAVLYNCSNELLSLFYGNSSPDIVVSTDMLVKYFSLTTVVYSLAGTAVFAVQAVGKAQRSIVPYAVSGVVRVVLNIILVQREELILYGAVISGAVGYLILMIWNVAILVRETRLKLDYIKVIVLPLMVFFATLCACSSAFNRLSGDCPLMLAVAIKFAFTAGFYCILCFLCRILNFREFFCYCLAKKSHQNA